LVDEYTLNAEVVGELIRWYNDRRGYARALGGRINAWDGVTDRSEELRRLYAHTLPQSESRLKAVIKRYQNEGYVALVSGKLGNSNTTKITNEAGRLIIALKRSRKPVRTDQQIFDEYNRVAPGRGMKVMRSINTLTAFLYRPDIEPLWWDAVHGELSAHQKYGRKNRTMLPTMRDSLWYGDGTKLNLYYRGDDGKVYTTQVYEVVDAATEVLLGYHISDTEDYEAQFHAYRMALQRSKHKPYEVVYDGQGGHAKLEAQAFFERLATKVHRRTAPYSGQSKTIEAVFGRFQAQVLHKWWNFTGMNITTKSDKSKPNVELIAANKEQLPTLSELKQIYAQAREEWNSMPHPATGQARQEMYDASTNPDTQEVTIYDMIDLFWVWTDRPATFTTSGIEIRIKGRKYAYEVYAEPGVPDYEWRRKHTNQKFRICYDPYDMGSIRLYSIDKSGDVRFERTAETYMTIARARQDQKEGERAWIQKQVEAGINDRIERQAEARAIEYEQGMSLEQQGLNRPKLKGLKRDAEAQIERRMKKYTNVPIELETGRVTKLISQKTYGDSLLEEARKPAEVIDMKRVASKY
jgi:hypothetical protein